MQRGLFWIAVVLLGIGAAVIAASLVMRALGLDASFNLGDPAQFQFVLVPFWQIGLGLAVLGALGLWLSHLLRGAQP
jgi:hypothetical protein